MINKIVLLLVMIPVLVQAQKIDILQSYVEEGLKNNLSLQQESLEIKKSMEVIRQARALFYPRLTFNPTYSYALGGRKLSFPVGDLLNPAYKTLNELTGTNQFPTNIENVNELLAPTNFHDTKVNVQYAIFNPEIKYNYLIQKSLMSVQEAKKQVVENELRYNIESAYYQYLQTLEMRRIVESNHLILKELVRLNKKLVANSVATKEVVFSSEYEENKLLQQKAEVENASKVAKAYFNFLINRKLEEDIVVDSTLITTEMENASTLDNLKDKALTGRSELKQLDMSIQASRQALMLQQKSAILPTLFVGGNAGFQGYGYVFRNQAYMVGQLGMQWDLFKGFEKKAKAQQAKIQTDLLLVKKNEVENQIALQTTQAYYDLQSAIEVYKTSKYGLLSASQYFKVIDSRYKNGNVLLMEYVKAQSDMQTAEVQQVVSKYDVLIKKSMLNKITAEP